MRPLLEKPPFLWVAKERYGEIKTSDAGWTWPNEADCCTRITIPEKIGIDWINSATGLPTTGIYCNKDMAPHLLRALNLIYARGLVKYLETFDGCLNVRSIRGRPGITSTHAYALAIDINAKDNPLGGPNRQNPELIDCFKECGFLFGGDFRRIDAQHIQWAMW